MRVSELEFTTEMRENVWRGHSVQTTSDANRMIGNEQHAQNFIEEFGDVEIAFNEKYKHWKVPAFAEQRKRYCDAKQAHCDVYGSE
jgi:hypothetical protein